MTKTIIYRILMFYFLISGNYVMNAQTNISGFISTNTTWSLGGSPYIVVGNTVVPQGITLTIDPGVVVKFDRDKAMQIDGELRAVGTAQDKITFTSNQSTPAAGDWGKIQYTNTSVSAIYDSFGNYLSGCILKYCDLLYGGNLGSGIIHIESSSIYISHCKFLYSFKDGIFVDKSTMKIESSTVSHCHERGINIHDNNYSCGITIDNDTISYNAQAAVNFVGDACNVHITRNYFVSNNGGALYGGTISNFVVKNNYFGNNGGTCIWAAADTIRCNKFYGNTGQYLIYGGEFISENVFEYNSATIGRFSGYGQFRNNYVSNNNSTSNICEFIFTNPDTLTFFCDQNVFENNIGTSTVSLGGFHSITGNIVVYLNNNSFNDPQSQYELYNSLEWGNSNIFTNGNFWGGNSTQHIDSVIFDYFDYANSSVVYYTNNLTAEFRVDTTCSGIPLDVSEYSTFESLTSVFPNPANEIINVALKVSNGKTGIELYNLLGELQYADEFNGIQYSFNTNRFKPGLYLLKIKTQANSIIKRVIIQ